MKQIFHPYNLWEDCNNGILEKGFKEKKEEEMTQKAKKLLCNQDKFFKVGVAMVKKWKYSSEQHLTNPQRNRQAWIGQASCCYEYGIPEHITKYAWRLMDLKEQEEANSIADKIIELWEEEYAKEISKK